MHYTQLLALLFFTTLLACNPDPDPDGDGLNAEEEQKYGTDPDNEDTDGDGLLDAAEINEHGTDPTKADSDDDTLSDAEEIQETQTDPNQADSDGDGYLDGEEVEAQSDPNNGFDWPEGDGHWPDFSDEAEAAGLDAPGWSMGDVIHDIQLIDQFGQDFHLYQYYGFVILIDVSAGWCNPCKAVAEHAEALYQTYKDDGFVIVHILLDAWIEGDPPNQEFRQAWGEMFGLTFPLTEEVGQEGDPRYAVNQLRYGGTLQGGIPNFILLDRDLRIDFSDSGYDDEPIRNRIAELMAE